MRFAQVVVIEGKDAGEVWEDVSATLGDNNNLLADGHSCIFVGDPHKIADQDEYDSAGAALAILTAEPTGSLVQLVDVPTRPDGQYLFSDHGAATAFADALSRSGEKPEVAVQDPPIYSGHAAERLIAAERAALIEDTPCAAALPKQSTMRTFSSSTSTLRSWAPSTPSKPT